MPSTVSKTKASILTRTLAVLLAPITGLWSFVEGYAQKNVHRLKGTSLGRVALFESSLFEGVLGKVLTLIVVFAIIGGVAVSFFANLKTLVTVFNDTSATGNATVDGFLSIFGLIVAILGVFALIKLVQRASGAGDN